MLEARATLARRRAEPWISRLLRWLAARPGALRRLMWAASRVVPSRIARPQGGGWRLLAAIARAIGRRSDAFAGSRLAVSRHPASPNAPRVLLLQGCIGSAADRDTVASATRVLRRLGFPVVVAEATLCCGSLARQSGDAEAAARQSRALQAAVRDAQAEVVVACASGCHGGLQLALGAGTRVEDLLSLLERRFADTPMPLGAVGRRVALGVPCSQRTIDGGRAMRALLARVPGLEVQELPEGPGCCGAGGLQMVLHPDTAAPLRALRVDAVLASDCDTVATSNIGCRLQMEVGLAIDGHQRPVCHPVRIIEASMAAAEAGERP
jgi:glycolate oxidase iron-sulfur subunit